MLHTFYQHDNGSPSEIVSFTDKLLNWIESNRSSWVITIQNLQFRLLKFLRFLVRCCPRQMTNIRLHAFGNYKLHVSYIDPIIKSSICILFFSNSLDSYYTGFNNFFILLLYKSTENNLRTLIKLEISTGYILSLSDATCGNIVGML